MLNLNAEISLKTRPGIVFRADGLKRSSVHQYSECYSNKKLLV